VVEHARLGQERLREREGAARIAGQQDALGQRRGGAQVDRAGGHRARVPFHAMARKPPGAQTADTLRSAVDRTVQATLGQAQFTRDRAQEVVDELAGTAGKVRGALDDLKPASGEDVKSLGARLDALEKRVAGLEKAKGSGKGGARKS